MIADALSEKISYPIAINGTTVNNREDFYRKIRVLAPGTWIRAICQKPLFSTENHFLIHYSWGWWSEDQKYIFWFDPDMCCSPGYENAIQDLGIYRIIGRLIIYPGNTLQLTFGDNKTPSSFFLVCRRIMHQTGINIYLSQSNTWQH